MLLRINEGYKKKRKKSLNPYVHHEDRIRRKKIDQRDEPFFSFLGNLIEIYYHQLWPTIQRGIPKELDFGCSNSLKSFIFEL